MGNFSAFPIVGAFFGGLVLGAAIGAVGGGAGGWFSGYFTPWFQIVVPEAGDRLETAALGLKFGVVVGAMSGAVAGALTAVLAGTVSPIIMAPIAGGVFWFLSELPAEDILGAPGGPALGAMFGVVAGDFGGRIILGRRPSPRGNSLFSDYFLELTNGRLPSIPFLIRSIILFVVVFVLYFCAGVVKEVTDAGKPEDASVGAIIALAVVGLTLLIGILVCVFANLNIIAKRARDVGLPGWLTAIAVGVLAGASAFAAEHMFAAGPMTAEGLRSLPVVILAFLPTDWLRKET